MLFMFWQVLEVFTVVGQIHFFWTPEKRQLLFNQAFKNLMFLNIVTCNVNRLAKEHWLRQCVELSAVKRSISMRHCYSLIRNALSVCVALLIKFRSEEDTSEVQSRPRLVC